MNRDLGPQNMTPDHFSQLIASAWEKRIRLHELSDHFEQRTNCYRIFHGFSEGLSGVTIDRYGSTAILNHKTLLPVGDDVIVSALQSVFPFTTIVRKSHQSLTAKMAEGTGKNNTAGEVRCLFGDLGDGVLKVFEDGIPFFADAASLHSNGLYLDARSLRRWLRQNSTERRVLNLFAHTGSLGIAARLGGAKEVVHLDKSKEALGRIRYNYEFNDLVPDNRGHLQGDLYFHLPRAIKWGQSFDGIILDPPPKVPPPPHAPKHRPAGQDFATLISLCCKLLRPGSWLAAICHNFRVSHDQFEAEIVAASERKLTPFWRGTSEEDFPEPDLERRTRITIFSYSDA